METADSELKLILDQKGKMVLEWKILGFNNLMSEDKAFKELFRSSPGIQFGNRTWNLQLYPHLPEMIACLYMAKKYPGPPIKVHYAFGLKNASGMIEWRVEASGSFGPSTGRVLKRGVFLTQSELFQNMADLVLNDALTVTCCLTTIESNHIADSLCHKYRLQNLCLNGKNFDVTFKVRGKTFRAHKNVLAPRSPAFSALLSREADHRVDCNPRSFRHFLDYLYEEKFEARSVDNAFDLYELAFTYGVPELRELCVRFVVDRMRPGEAIDVIQFARRFSEWELMGTAKLRLVYHPREALSSERWLEFVRECPEDANELYLLISRTLAP